MSEHMKSASNSSAKKREAVSLFNYLNPAKTFTPTFKTMLSKIIPGAQKEHIDKMLYWVQKEEEIAERAVINYKMPRYAKREQKLNQKLGFKHLRDFLHIFVGLDSNHDYLLSVDDFAHKYHDILTKADILRYFERFNKTEADQLNLEEFLKVMLPEDCIIPQELIDTECRDYVKWLTAVTVKEKNKAH